MLTDNVCTLILILLTYLNKTGQLVSYLTPEYFVMIQHKEHLIIYMQLIYCQWYYIFQMPIAHCTPNLLQLLKYILLNVSIIPGWTLMCFISLDAGKRKSFISF